MRAFLLICLLCIGAAAQQPDPLPEFSLRTLKGQTLRSEDLKDSIVVLDFWATVTVISETFNLGMGDKFDQTATREMPAGTFGFWPAEMKHFAWAKGETVLQLHGIGPWMITYINAADDPRNMKK